MSGSVGGRGITEAWRMVTRGCGCRRYGRKAKILRWVATQTRGVAA